MTKQQKRSLAMVGVLCFVSVFIAAMSHLYFSALQIHLSMATINSAFGLGMIAGLLTVGNGNSLNCPIWGFFLGAVICYFLAVSYIVVGHGIPVEWIY
ncbi:MAG: hypothetical protein QM501_08940 [Gimesia sp.]